MAGVYQIRDWPKHFEVAQSKQLKEPGRSRWVAIPNKHDGKSFRRLMRLPNGPAIYGAWILIVQVASKCPVRGRLEDDDGPLSAEDISDKTYAPVELIQSTLDACCSKAIGWITLESDHSQCSEAGYQPAKGKFPTGQDITGHNITGEDDSSDESEPEPAEPPIMVFPCVGKGPTEWPLRSDKLAEYGEAYPGVDVLGEARKALQWLRDNPSRQKTFSGMSKFLNAWMSRAQNGSRGSPRASGPKLSGIAAFLENHRDGD